MCGYFCIGFINFMLKGKSLLDYINLFSPSEYKKNNKIEPTALFVVSMEKTKTLKYQIKNITSFYCLQ